MAYICPLCSKYPLATKDDLYHHQMYDCPYKDRYTPPSPYKCGACNVGFATKAAYDLHMSTVHPIESFICTRCCQRFSTKAALERHMASEHQETLPERKCPYCPATFTTIEELDRHKQSEHGAGGGDPYYPVPPGVPPPDYPGVPPYEPPPYEPEPPPDKWPEPEPPSPPVLPDEDVPFTETRWFPIVLIVVAVVVGIIAIAVVARN